MDWVYCDQRKATNDMGGKNQKQGGIITQLRIFQILHNNNDSYAVTVCTTKEQEKNDKKKHQHTQRNTFLFLTNILVVII